MKGFFLLLLFLPGISFAQAQQLGSCRIAVRMLSVSDSPGADSLEMSSFLEDVRDQLSPLPFKGYQVVDFKETTTSFGKKGRVSLRAPNNPPHVLSVIPHGSGQEKVLLTVDWRDGERRSLLSTKIRVRQGENVVLGTDAVQRTPLLVAIKVYC